MDFRECPNCKRYDFMDKHKCPPAWEVVIVDYDDETEPREGYGLEADDAALDVIERKFHDLDCPEETEVWVRKDSAHEWEKFIIYMEPVPSFSAKRKE